MKLQSFNTEGAAKWCPVHAIVASHKARLTRNGHSSQGVVLIGPITRQNDPGDVKIGLAEMGCGSGCGYQRTYDTRKRALGTTIWVDRARLYPEMLLSGGIAGENELRVRIGGNPCHEKISSKALVSKYSL